MPKAIDRTGQRFGRLLVIKRNDEQYGTNGIVWYCQCDCGKYTAVGGGKLQSGHTRSCGCLMRDTTIKRSTKHGMCGTKEYEAWCGMKKRCDNTYGKFPTYEEKGIKVCPEWLNNFEAFYEYIGKAPENNRTWSVGRIDNNKDYAPGNVRWEQDLEQARNHSRQKNNSSGTTGVYKKTDTRDNRQYWVAFWNISVGVKQRKSFSVSKYGEELAKQLAIDYRYMMLEKLKDSGIAYAESHGTAKES